MYSILKINFENGCKSLNKINGIIIRSQKYTTKKYYKKGYAGEHHFCSFPPFFLLVKISYMYISLRPVMLYSLFVKINNIRNDNSFRLNKTCLNSEVQSCRYDGKLVDQPTSFNSLILQNKVSKSFKCSAS